MVKRAAPDQAKVQPRDNLLSWSYLVASPVGSFEGHIQAKHEVLGQGNPRYRYRLGVKAWRAALDGET